MTTLLVGGGGVLGSGFQDALRARREPVVRVVPDWGRVASLGELLAPHLREHVAATGPATVVWTAGVGAVGVTEAQMEAETQGLRQLCAQVGALPAEAAQRLSLLFSSSAGALFAGHGSSPVDELSVPSPTSDYGRVKLVQEQVLRQLADRTGCRVLVCRFSNVYGLASGRLTPRGLVAAAVRATRSRQPMVVYVSPDSRRDYVYARDAAVRSLERLRTAPPGASTTLVCAAEVRTVSSVIALVGHVAGRRVPATYAERPETRLQPKVLRFARHLRPDSPTTSMETAVHLMVRAPVA